MGEGQLREMKRVIKPNGVKRDRIGGRCDVQVCSARVAPVSTQLLIVQRCSGSGCDDADV